jgi:asparagine synthase (glutamine-hydrolysing)
VRRFRRRPPAVLVIVQNLPVPFDRRVWLECLALRAAGFEVSVVCPKGCSDPAYEVLEGVHIYKYPPAPEARGMLGFVGEFAYSFLATLRLAVKAWRRRRFDVIQACNPPDTFWLLALFFRPFGVKFVYDQHDLCPELYESRFPDGSSLVTRILLALERATYRSAHHVIVTNGSYRSKALERGGVPEDRVTIVRTGPDPELLTRGEGKPEHRRGFEHLAVYIGVMGPQDGVDIAIRAAAHLKHKLSRKDIGITLIGSGDCFEELKALAVSLAVDDIVHFTGRAPDSLVAEIMSSAEVGLSPDPKSPLNDVSTMNKTMEYMAFGLPVVAFDLTETRVSAEDAAVYAEPNDVAAFAQTIADLVDDADGRALMSRIGRERVEQVLAWPIQAPNYVGVYQSLTGFQAEAGEPAAPVPAEEPIPVTELTISTTGPAESERTVTRTVLAKGNGARVNGVHHLASTEPSGGQ